MNLPISREPIAPSDVQIHVIVPFYNCQRFISRSLLSIADQTHSKVNVVAVDDCSSDSGGTYAKMICERAGWTYHRTETNLKCPHTLVVAVELTKAEPRDVIFILDGDDYLPHEGVLARWAEIFAEADTWMTFGQYMSDPPDWHCTPAVLPPESATIERSWRLARPIFFNHPIAFRKFLFDAIPHTEFQDDDGNWFQAGYDRTLVYPLMELATSFPRDDENWKIRQPVHWRFINEIGYVYNSVNPNSEWRLGQAEAEKTDIIYDRPPLNPLRLHFYDRD